MNYTVKRNRSSVHIAGIEIRTATRPEGEEAASARGFVAYTPDSACGALTRSGHRMAAGASYDDVAEALKDARLTARIGNLNLCSTCEAAAEREAAQTS